MDSSWASLRTSSGHLLLMNQSDYRLLNAVYMLIIGNNNFTHRVIRIHFKASVRHITLNIRSVLSAAPQRSRCFTTWTTGSWTGMFKGSSRSRCGTPSGSVPQDAQKARIPVQTGSEGPNNDVVIINGPIGSQRRTDDVRDSSGIQLFGSRTRTRRGNLKLHENAEPFHKLP